MDAAGINPGPTTASALSAISSASPSLSASTNPAVSIPVSSNVHGDGGVIKRRAPIACRRCRRMRSKCIHDKAHPPCKSCFEAGLSAEECEFPQRGQPDNDREYRHPRTRADRSSRQPGTKNRRSGTDGPAGRNHAADDWSNLPPLPDLIDGVNRFTCYYFQLGFIPKQQYPDRLRHDHRSVNLFLLLSILSISSRMSPSLKARYGTGVKAAEFFMERASNIAIGEVYQEPTLERCQAFYLLSIAQQGSGMRNKSYINMGIAVRMAALMQLHREETYSMQNPTPELITRAESARRTLWMLHSQDSLHSGPLSPVSLGAADITALLPCNEEDFAHGREPRSRAALEGTPPALENASLIRDPNRSLFATLIQIHYFWGVVGRRAVSYSRSSRPWDPTSEFSLMANKLKEWEQNLPHEHMWSNFLLKGYKAEGQDLAYLCVTMMTRLCNIVLRRPYLVDVIKADLKNEQKQAYFADLSKELFRNVRQLYEQVDAQFTDRTPDESVGAQIAAFCVYSCGLFSTYICKYPQICQDAALAQDGPAMLQRTIAILTECKQVWPLASRWVEALEKSLDPQQDSFATEGGSMDDGKDPFPRAIRQLPMATATMTPPPHGPPPAAALPDNTVLPKPGTQTDAQSPHSGIMPCAPPANSTNGHLASPGQQHHQLQQPYQIQTGSSHVLVQPQQQQQQHAFQQQMRQPISPASSIHHHQQPQSMYMPRAPVDGLGMLIEAFDSHHPAQHQQHQQHQHHHNNPYQAAPYFPPLGPGNDGFEGELQFYIQGPPSTWMNTGAWLDAL